MNKLVQVTLVGIAFLALAFQAMGDPSDFIVGDLTFVRPPSWQWEDLKAKDQVEASLIIRDEATPKELKVIFFLTGSDKDQIAKKWKESFVAPPAVIFSTETKTVGKVELTYIHVKGTFHSATGKTGTDYELLGAVFKTSKGNLFVRALGDSGIVTRITPEFIKMIEDALHEN